MSADELVLIQKAVGVQVEVVVRIELIEHTLLDEPRLELHLVQNDAFDTFDDDDSFGIDEDEFETGVFDTWDADDDFGIDEDEWNAGIGMF